MCALWGGGRQHCRWNGCGQEKEKKRRVKGTLKSFGLSNSKDGVATYQGREGYQKSILGGERARIRYFEHVTFLSTL